MKGVRFYFDGGMNQFVSGVSVKEIIKKVNDSEKDNWIAFDDQIVINLKKVYEFYEDEYEEDS